MNKKFKIGYKTEDKRIHYYGYNGLIKGSHANFNLLTKNGNIYNKLLADIKYEKSKRYWLESQTQIIIKV